MKKEIFPADPPYNEGWVETEIPVYSFPDDKLGHETGVLKNGESAAVLNTFDSWLWVRQNGLTGFIRDDGSLIPPGGNGEGQYYITVNLHDFTLIVQAADENGRPTGEPIHEALVCIGKKTTPTPTGVFELKNYEQWHRFGPSYAPYAMAISQVRWVHGELCSKKDITSPREDRQGELGKAKSGGCVRMPIPVAQWIYYHCAPGTKIEIIPGNK